MGLKAVSLLSTDPQVLEVTKQLESVAEEPLGPWSLGKGFETLDVDHVPKITLPK